MFLFLFLCAVKGKSAFNTGHARQFRFPFTFIQTDALRKCLAVLDLLRHPEVAERPGGKLWPVRYQKHLAALGKSFEPFRNREWARRGECASCKMFRYCLGGGMHLHGDDGGLLYCHYHRL